VRSAHVLIILFACERVTLKYGVYFSVQEPFLPLPESLLVVTFKGFHKSGFPELLIVKRASDSVNCSENIRGYSNFLQSEGCNIALT
jgi:hypothetical protein